jgi:hypothetical protein
MNPKKKLFIELYESGYHDGCQQASIAYDVGRPEMYSRGSLKAAEKEWERKKDSWGTLEIKKFDNEIFMDMAAAMLGESCGLNVDSAKRILEEAYFACWDAFEAANY